VPILSLLFVAAMQVTAPAAAPNLDALFAQWTVATPGCAVGVDLEGRSVLEKGFGMADLERGVPNKPDTIFEAGSVSKQFTAAAVLLLASDGKLSLDDPIRKYIPELPDYGTPVTIRHLLTHTSGLRDWGSVAGIAGWPRTTRVYTHAHVIDILSRQRSLNFAPGTRWSYSNSGFNLAAVLVARVSGMPFPEFTRQRLFNPLGMTSTSWREDHTRIVPRRALAYERLDDGYHLELPFENVYGNGGLLTTVGDLLKWTRNFQSPVVGDAAFVREQTTPGRFSDGRAHDYGMGVWVDTYRGVREVRHSGSTAGYRAFLTTFPEARASVAVLCNAADAAAETIAYKVVDAVLAASLGPRDRAAGRHTLTESEVAGLSGLYRNAATSVPTRIVRDGAGVKIERGAVLSAESGTSLLTPSGQRWLFGADGQVTVTDAFGRVDRLVRAKPWSPSAEELQRHAGEYISAEAEAAVTAKVVDGTLVLWQRPDRTVRLTPVYDGVFSSPMGTILFHQDGFVTPSALSVSQDRVWDLRFERRR
jgi:CubicO group peptidase (beta-lactamase class C family)